MTLKAGDILETAMWADGKETKEQLEQYGKDLQEHLDYFAEQEEVLISSLTIIEKKPGEDRVPPVPDNIQGPNVRLLVGTAKVICNKPKFTIHRSRFVDELEPKDLERLREITRAAYKRHFPHHGELSDYECDEVIEQIGPDAALDALRNSKTTMH